MSEKALLFCRSSRDILSLGAIRCHKVGKVAGGFEKPLHLGYYDGGCGLGDLGLVFSENAHCKKDKSHCFGTLVAQEDS